MKSWRRSLALIIAGIMAVLTAQIAEAQPSARSQRSNHPATTVKEWVAQLEESANESPVQLRTYS